MIGVFDSGFGGLTVLSAFLKELPDYDYLYLGDTARAPYGNHSKETILKFTREGVNFLFGRGARLVILACNTASANALRELQEEFIRKGEGGDWAAPNIRNILGVVIPIVEEIARLNPKRVALIGTRATVASKVYETELQKRKVPAKVVSAACPLLVPLIEEGWANRVETKRILKTYLRPLKTQNPDLLVPACTHYPILQKEIERAIGKKVSVLNTGKIIAKSLRSYLERHPEIDSLLGKNSKRQFFSTDDPEKFREIGKRFFGHPISEVERAKL